MSDTRERDALVAVGRSLFERGLTHGSTGNLSLRVRDGFLMTPTGSSLGALDPARLALLDFDGVHLRGDPPTKEAQLHIAMYRERPDDTAVVHLHATHSVAVSVLADTDAGNALPPLTAYYAMRVGTLPMLPYYAPGDAALAQAVGRAARDHHALLLAHHGPVVSGRSLDAATDAIEELEATARLWLLVKSAEVRVLDASQVDELARRFPR
jgi:ribulose-5-phosphate 4-epimerase/fuculose-1-phosphate aldolase